MVSAHSLSGAPRKPAKPAPRFGSLLVHMGRLTQKQLTHALEVQKRCRMPLGDVLVGEGLVTYRDVRDALARQYNMPTADLLQTPPNAALCRHEHRTTYHKLGLIPWCSRGGTVVVAVTQLNDLVYGWLRTHYGNRYKLVWATPLDIQRSLTQLFGDQDALDSCQQLPLTHPHFSAKTLFSLGQRITLASIALLLVVGLALFPMPTLSLLSISILSLFTLTLVFKGLLFVLGRVSPAYKQTDVPLLSDDKLPRYTVLAPLYDEQRSLPGLIKALRAMDYPHSKLDIKLIVEKDDRLTHSVLESLRPESYFDIIVVPPSEPRTKPKACNYALRFAKGDIVTIVDAEDRMEPLQLRKAASYFMSAGGRTTCLQARLNYHNRDENWLTRLFAIEYAAWFGFMLKGLHRLKAPIPLGGTSNHILTDHLHRLGGWDAYNVTEDADLGVRIAISGGKTALVDSVTLEEAPARFMPWLRQRTRWIKGYMQTYIVHMRRPGLLLEHLGIQGFLGFQLFIGGPTLVFLLTPLMWVLALSWLVGLVPPPSSASVEVMLTLTWVNLALSLIVHLVQAFAVLRYYHWKGWKMALAALCFPFYWLLHSVASFRALWHLLYCPHSWEKTPHLHTAMRGLSFDNA